MHPAMTLRVKSVLGTTSFVPVFQGCNNNLASLIIESISAVRTHELGVHFS